MGRMTPPRSPMTKSPMVCEKDETGCMWHLYGLFNFRQGYSKKKLLSNRRHLNRLDDGNFNTRLNLLNKRDEKCQNIDDLLKNRSQTIDSDMASKRKLKGEELSTELQMNKKIATDEVKHIQPNSNLVDHLPNNNGKVRKTRQRSHDTTVSVEKPLNKINSAARPEVISKEVHSKNGRGFGCKSIDTMKHGQLNEINLMPVQMNAAESIINQKFIDGVNHQSEQLSVALGILSSNKELFLKLLHDPNSLLVKHIRDLRESQASKHKSKSLCEANIKEYWTSKARQSDGSSGIHNLKTSDLYPSLESDDSELSERIIVLKPGPPSMKDSADRIKNCSSLQSYYSLRNNRQSERHAKFSVNSMKRKLKHSVGVSSKEQHSNSVDGVHISPNQFAEVDCKGKGVGIIRKTSPGTADDRVIKSFDIKKRDSIGKVKECESSIGREAGSTGGSGLNLLLVNQPMREESETFVGAVKHLSKLLNDGNTYKSYFARQAQKTWGRVTSFPEYDFMPRCRPERDWVSWFVNEQMRFSPYRSCQLVYENKWRLQKEKKTCCSSPLRQDVKALLDNTKLDLEVFDTGPNISDYPFTDISFQGDNSSPKGCVQVVENNNTMHHGETNSFEVPSEYGSSDKCSTVEASSSISPGNINSFEVLFKPDCTEKIDTKETNDTTYQGEANPSEILPERDCTDKALEQSTETNNMHEKVEYFEDFRLPLPSSPDVFPSTPSIERVEDAHSIEDKGEQPSPVSVLEQFLVDATSPASTISELAEECHSATPMRSPLDLETSSLNQREFISEYVRAVLQVSSLNWDELSMMFHSSYQLHEPFLLDAVKLQASQFHGDCVLLFDCINEVLVKVYHTHLPCSPWLSFLKSNVSRHLSIERTVIHEVNKYVDWHLLCHPSPRTMQQLVEKDVACSRTWLDIRNEAEEVVFEMVEGVLEELIMETILLQPL